MIQINHLNHAFNDTHPLFKDLHLTVTDSDNVALIGPSGSGKSTLLRYMLAIKKPDRGQILIDGQDIFLLSDSDLVEIRLNIGMLFQSAALFDSLSVEENVAFPLVENFGYSLTASLKKVNNVLEMVDLDGYNNKMPYQLSGGQRKRVGLARAIITEPKYLFYDEPTAGLDPITSTNIENLIIRLNTVMKTTSIVVSHERSTILRTAQKIFMIHDHALLDYETPDTILSSPNDVVRNFMKG